MKNLILCLISFAFFPSTGINQGSPGFYLLNVQVSQTNCNTNAGISTVFVYDGNNNTVMGPDNTNNNGFIEFTIPLGLQTGWYTIEAEYPVSPNTNQVGTTKWYYTQGNSDSKQVCLGPPNNIHH